MISDECLRGAILRRWKGALVLVALVPVLSACAAGSTPLTRPAANIAVPGQWTNLTVADVDSSAAEYWQALRDPLLDEFVAQAVRQNQDIASATARLAQARAQFEGARSSFLPQVSAGGSAQRDIGTGASHDIDVSLSGSAIWEIDLSGRIGASVAASRGDLASAGYNLDDVRRFTVARVADSTILARATAVQLAIAQDSLRIADDNLQIARWRNMAGLVSSLDVEQARNQRAQVAAGIPALEASLAATAHAISTLIGEPPGRVLGLLQGSRAVPAPPALAGFAAPAEVIERRPDVRAAEARLTADLARVRGAKSQLLPQVQLSGSIGTSSFGPRNLFDILTGNVLASVSQLLFDGGRTRAQIRSAQAVADGSLAAWRQAILGALEDVETGIARRRASEERLTDLIEARDAAETASQLARIQYQSGLIDFSRLLTAENSLVSARNGLIAAESDRARAFVTLTQALGGGWPAGDNPSPDRTKP